MIEQIKNYLSAKTYARWQMWGFILLSLLPLLIPRVQEAKDALLAIFVAFCLLVVGAERYERRKRMPS